MGNCMTSKQLPARPSSAPTPQTAIRPMPAEPPSLEKKEIEQEKSKGGDIYVKIETELDGPLDTSPD